MTPQETDPDLPMSVEESLVEAWVGGALLQGRGQCMQQCLLAWGLLKEVAIIFMTSTIV